MALINKIATGLGIATLATISLIGCETESFSKEKEKNKEYFAEIPVYESRGGGTMVSGDFNEDGHLDIIYGNSSGQLYFFENDGKGNFKLREYSK